VLLTTGSKIVYPSQGPCLIGPMIERVIDDRPLRFYQLLVLNEGGGDLFIPVDKVDRIGIRPLLEPSEIPSLLNHLTQRRVVADNYRQRNLHITSLFASGSAYHLAEIVGSLTQLHSAKPLSFGEHKALEKAKGLLVCEIAEVLGITLKTATEQVETALQSRPQKVQADSSASRRMASSRNRVRSQVASS
jgi:RNA polymerase-interacting CarD/CdnL/TRCF family regulator